ncbi:hypothetical protein [Halogeometricum sp. CBA1124]|uniref:hypothetical protein n=1 Tax=Halogeometricum sp. CBA1124 TaxID=2668071 RepID=UPI001428F81F|nr:hypothetical protein [Halogeometricum sp. CBA1124]MUV56560.1 hypothetical protein [Halogeometricum sp. CBA1124]
MSPIQQYATGSGIALGAGVGATAATVSGVDSQLGIVVGLDVSGGLVVGGFAGRFAESNLQAENWELRLGAFTLLVSLLVGGLLGTLVGWMVDGSLLHGFLVGSGVGGLFSHLMSGTVIMTGRKHREESESAD